MSERCKYNMNISCSVHPRVLCCTPMKGNWTSCYSTRCILILGLIVLLLLQLLLALLLREVNIRPRDEFAYAPVRELTLKEYSMMEARSVSSLKEGKNSTDLCDAFPNTLKGKIDSVELPEIFPKVRSGGFWQPNDCEPRHTVAVIVPYRDRAEHLTIFLKYIHTLLSRQKIEYRIFIVEQVHGSTFNRGMLMNVGYLEAMKSGHFSCLIFHDVDLIPETDNNLYSCPVTPRHMSVAIDIFGYKNPYSSLFGGVVAFSKEHFKLVNGYANRYFGWGGEDDDIRRRVDLSGLPVLRTPDILARYRMLKHERDAGNKVNPLRYSEMKRSLELSRVDGLSALIKNPNMYKVLETKLMELHTYILVDINITEVFKDIPTLPPQQRRPWIVVLFKGLITT